MTALRLVSDKKIFENCIFKTYFLTYFIMQPTEMVWTTLAEDHPGIIPDEFGQIQWVLSEEKSIEWKKLTHTYGISARQTKACHNS